MVTKNERQTLRAEVAKRMKDQSDTVHALAVRVPFWRIDDAGDQIMMCDMDGRPRITFRGGFAHTMSKWITMSAELPAWRWPT